MDTQIQFGNSKEQIKRMFNSLSHIKETIDNDVRRKIGESCRGCFFSCFLQILEIYVLYN